jgi:hypothetical protein
MTYNKPEPIPVQVMTDKIDEPGFLHSSVGGKRIVEVTHRPTRWRLFLAVEPHQVKSRTHEEYIRREEAEHAA